MQNVVLQNYFTLRLSDIAKSAFNDCSRVRESAFVMRIVVASQQTINTGYVAVGETDFVVGKGRGALGFKKFCGL